MIKWFFSTQVNKKAINENLNITTQSFQNWFLIEKISSLNKLCVLLKMASNRSNEGKISELKSRSWLWWSFKEFVWSHTGSRTKRLWQWTFFSSDDVNDHDSCFERQKDEDGDARKCRICMQITVRKTNARITRTGRVYWF